MNKTDRLDRSQWKLYQNLMQDCGRFVELVHTIEWEDGLKPDMTLIIENYFMKGKDGQLGITGEGTLLDNAKGAFLFILI